MSERSQSSAFHIRVSWYSKLCTRGLETRKAELIFYNKIRPSVNVANCAMRQARPEESCAGSATFSGFSADLVDHM
jgi:hypothetical protein